MLVKQLAQASVPEFKFDRPTTAVGVVASSPPSRGTLALAKYQLFRICASGTRVRWDSLVVPSELIRSSDSFTDSRLVNNERTAYTKTMYTTERNID